jgi:hypothetical protein
MSGATWFALGGVALSCLALAVSFVAYRLQAKTIKSDEEKELADQIDAIQAQLAKLGPVPPSENSLAAMATMGNVNSALQALLLRVATLIKSAGLHPGWYQNLVLAMAALQVGDLVSAGPYAKNAVDLAGSPLDPGWDPKNASVAQVVSLSTRAVFFFNRGLDTDEGLGTDEDQARAHFDAARTVVSGLQPRQGRYLTAAQLIELNVRQASWEIDLGHPGRGIQLMAAACDEWLAIRAPLVQQNTGILITTYAGNQNSVPVAQLLTEGFRGAWAGFQREHQANAAQLPDLSTLSGIYPGRPPAPGDATPAGPAR